jgi:hypothetical protein
LDLKATCLDVMFSRLVMYLGIKQLKTRPEVSACMMGIKQQKIIIKKMPTAIGELKLIGQVHSFETQKRMMLVPDFTNKNIGSRFHK